VFADLEAGDRLDVAVACAVEVTEVPVRQAQQRCGSTTLQVVVRADQTADASGVLDGSVDVAVEEGQSGSMHCSHRRQTAVCHFVEHDR
jgi:hypothetical protein